MRDAARRAARRLLPLRGVRRDAPRSPALGGLPASVSGIRVAQRPSPPASFNASYGTAAACRRRHDDVYRPGVYGLEGLHAPEDFQRLADRAVAKCDDIVSALVRGGGLAFGQTAAASSGVIDDLDEISDTVCAVVDVTEVRRALC